MGRRGDPQSPSSTSVRDNFPSKLRQSTARPATAPNSCNVQGYEQYGPDDDILFSEQECSSEFQNNGNTNNTLLMSDDIDDAVVDVST